MNSRKALKCIHLQDNSDVFIMSNYDEGNKLFIKVLNVRKNEAYIGHASDADLRLQAATVRLTLKDFMSKTSQVLFKNTTEHSDYKCVFEERDEKYFFKWKSVDSEGTVVHLGTVPMKKMDYEMTLVELLQALSGYLESLSDNISHLESDVKSSKNQTAQAVGDLSAASEAKDRLEKEMFAKFVLILNEKKCKIRDLKSNCSVKKSPVFKKKTETYQKRHEHILSDSDEEVDGELNVNQAGPSKSTNNSLLFPDDSPSIVAVTQSKLRKRKAPSNKSSEVSEKNGHIKSKKTVFKAAPISDDSDDLFNCM